MRKFFFFFFKFLFHLSFFCYSFFFFLLIWISLNQEWIQVADRHPGLPRAIRSWPFGWILILSLLRTLQPSLTKKKCIYQKGKKERKKKLTKKSDRWQWMQQMKLYSPVLLFQALFLWSLPWLLFIFFF